MTPAAAKNPDHGVCSKPGAPAGMPASAFSRFSLLAPLLVLALNSLTGCLSSDDSEVEGHEQKPPTRVAPPHEPVSQASAAQKSEATSSEPDEERTEGGGDESFTPSEAIIGGIKKLNPLQLIDKIDDTLQDVLPKGTPGVSARELAGLQSRVRSLEQELLDLRGELSVLKRSFRSGLLTPVEAEGELGFEELDMPQRATVGLSSEAGRTAESERGGRFGPSGSAATPVDVYQGRTLQSALAEGPFELLESATASIERSDYGAAVVLLQALQTKFPGYRDEGLGDVLLGESWLALKSPDRAVQPLTRMIGLYPSGNHMPRAKLALARAYNQLGERQRSIQLLLDVIALAPSTPIADMARAQLALQGEAR